MRYILLVLLAFVTTFASAQVQFLGSPTTTVRNRGNFVSDSLFYLPKRTKAPSDSGALRYQISDSALYVWTGSQWIKAGGGSGSVLISDTASMLNPYTRGSGTVNYVPKFTGTRTFGNSIIYDDGEVKINTAADSGNYKLQINGDFYSNYGNYIRGNPSDKTRALSISGDPLTVTLWLEEYQTGGGAPDVFFRSGQGTLFAKSNSAVGNNLGGINWAGYVDGTFSPSIDFTTTVVNIDATNKRADANLTLFQTYNSSAQANVRFYANGGGIYVRGETLLGSETDYGAYQLQVTGSIYNTTGAVFAASSGNVGIGGSPSTKFHVYGATTLGGYTELNSSAAASSYLNMGYGGANKSYWGSAAGFDAGTADEYVIGTLANSNFSIYTNAVRRARFTGDGELLLNTTSDAGAYALQVAGSIYNTTGAVLAASSGNVGINTTSASQKLQVKGSILADSSITATGDLKVLQGVTTGFFNNEGLLASHNGSRRVQMRYLAREHLFSSGQVEAAAIFIDSTANVGIGTSSPTSKLFVSGGDFNVSGGSIIASTPATANNTTKNMLALLAGTDATNGPTAIYIDLRHSTTGTNRRVDIYSADNTNYRNISFPYAELLVGSTTDAGAYALQVAGAIYNTTTLTTGAPTSGSAKPWRLGEAATVSPTSPNRTIRVEIDGTVYYIHAKTTND